MVGLHPPKLCLHPDSPVPADVALLGNRVSVDVGKLHEFLLGYGGHNHNRSLFMSGGKSGPRHTGRALPGGEGEGLHPLRTRVQGLGLQRPCTFNVLLSGLQTLIIALVEGPPILHPSPGWGVKLFSFLRHFPLSLLCGYPATKPGGPADVFSWPWLPRSCWPIVSVAAAARVLLCLPCSASLHILWPPRIPVSLGI